MAPEYRSWPVAVLIAIDQLGNTLAGGNPNATISARVGFFSEMSKHGKSYWKNLESIIDFAFFPIDGPRHCYQTWQADKDEQFKRGNDFMLIILSIIIVVVCPVIAIVLHMLVLFIRPWKTL